ncbi:MAG: hypothetical protein E7627_08705 [Ruminococcaceae bacterium]|nr:hypothetical protein [Oscillospiraceae bacterium]
MIYCTKPNTVITASSTGNAIVHDGYSKKRHYLNKTATIILLLLETYSYNEAKSCYVELFELPLDIKNCLHTKKLEEDFDEAVNELVDRDILLKFDESEENLHKIADYFRSEYYLMPQIFDEAPEFQNSVVLENEIYRTKDILK